VAEGPAAPLGARHTQALGSQRAQVGHPAPQGAKGKRWPRRLQGRGAGGSGHRGCFGTSRDPPLGGAAAWCSVGTGRPGGAGRVGLPAGQSATTHLGPDKVAKPEVA